MKRPEHLQSVPPLYGLVLAGGMSSLMGTDKGSLSYHGVQEARRLYSILSSLCERTFVSLRPGQIRLPVYTGLPVITDVYEGIGPAAGILSAFRLFPNSAWLVAAVDMPGIGYEQAEFLVRERYSGAPATAPYNETERLPQPLFAIWEPQAAERLRAAVASGQYSLRYVLGTLPVHRVPEEHFGMLGNINTGEEYGVLTGGRKL